MRDFLEHLFYITYDNRMLHKIGVLKNLLNSLENCARVRRSLACNFTKNVNVQRAQFKSVQVRTAGGRVMECEYILSLTIFLLFFFAWKYADFTNT